MNVIGDVEGKDVLILDDIIDTAGTLCNAAAAIKERGARSVNACATHGVLSGNALENVCNSVIDEIVLLDTIDITEKAKKCDKIKVLTVAPVFAEAIARIYSDKPISSMFV